MIKKKQKKECCTDATDGWKETTHKESKAPKAV